MDSFSFASSQSSDSNMSNPVYPVDQFLGQAKTIHLDQYYHIGHYGHALAAHQISVIKRTLGIDDKACTVGLDRQTQEHLLNSVSDVGKSLDESLPSLASSDILLEEFPGQPRITQFIPFDTLCYGHPPEAQQYSVFKRLIDYVSFLKGSYEENYSYHVDPLDGTHHLHPFDIGYYGQPPAAQQISLIKRALDIDDKACKVALNRRVREVRCLLDSESFVVGNCIVAICGIPWIGKSTLAHEVYRCIGKQLPYHFFFDKAEEYLLKPGFGKLLSILAGDDNINVKQNKFFLIFEDIDDPESLKAVIQLSKVVITAKDHRLLETHGIDKIYNVEKFNNFEAYELLGRIVHQSENIPISCVDIIYQAAKLSSGIPGLLKIIGSNLAGKQKKECEHILAEYKKIRNGFGI